MYHIVICDDDLEFINSIKSLITAAGISENDAQFHEYTSSQNFVSDLNQLKAIDLLILDMQMPDFDGNQVAKHFREYFPSSLLVFCSGVYQPTVKSFETSPFRYLLKEYTDKKMLTELYPIINELKKKKNEPYIVGSWHYCTSKYRPSEILYICHGRNCCEIHIHPNAYKHDYEKFVKTEKKLEQLYDELKDFNFEFPHNSYIVNLQYIKRKTVAEMELIDGTILTISRSKEKEFRAAFTKYISKKY